MTTPPRTLLEKIWDEHLVAAPQGEQPMLYIDCHLIKQERLTEARAALREGIDAARQQDKSHAAGEMAELLMSLGEAGEG